MRASMSLLNEYLVSNEFFFLSEYETTKIFDMDDNKQKLLICKTIVTLWRYFITANYSWVLMESFYLHQLIYVDCYNDKSIIKFYVLLGWGMPLVLIIIWVINRLIFDDEYCWILHSSPWQYYIIKIPIIVSIMINFILFINMIRILFVKMKNSLNLQQRQMTYKRWLRATFVLIPLLNVPGAVSVSLNFIEDDIVQMIWMLCDQLFLFIQGFFVASWYSLLNSDIRSEIRLALRRQRTRSINQ